MKICYCKQIGKIDKLDKTPYCQFCFNSAEAIHKIDKWVYSVCNQCHSMFADQTLTKQRIIASTLKMSNPYKK